MKSVIYKIHCCVIDKTYFMTLRKRGYLKNYVGCREVIQVRDRVQDKINREII